MAESSIPVDLFNPGQVFACLGFLEVADILLGDAEGGFDWSDETNVRFVLHASGGKNSFEVVLGFLAQAQIQGCAPIGYSEPPPTKKGRAARWDDGGEEDGAGLDDLVRLETFPSQKGDRMALPIRLEHPECPPIDLGHWADDSSRNRFKLYAGNRSAAGIARAMVRGTQSTEGIQALWDHQTQALATSPLDLLTPMGGSFNFDPRGAWTALDAGYSPNRQEHEIAASPVVELLAALGLEHARPDEYETRRVRYGVWNGLVPPILARPALAGAAVGVPVRRFGFVLDLSGKNKVVTFAQEESAT